MGIRKLLERIFLPGAGKGACRAGRMGLRLGYLLLLTGLSGSLQAQQLLFRNYSVREGLASNTVWCIAQDDQGYMWFGTKNGLSRFDGYQFKSFQFDRDAPGSIGNNFIHSITRYDSTTYWIGTEGGIYILDLESERFRHFQPLASIAVLDILKSRDGQCWIGTKGKGLYRYDPVTEELSNFNLASGKEGETVSGNQIRKLIEDDEGNLWIATFGAGVDVFDRRTGRFRNYRGEGAGLHSNYMLTLYKAQDGTVWAGSLKGGLSAFSKASGSFRTYRSAGPNSLSDDIVRAISQPSPGKLYVGTEKGLNIFHIAEGRFELHSKRADDPYSLSDNAVYSILPDREGGVWVGTYFGGVDYFRENGSGFELYYPTGSPRSLSGSAVSCFLEAQPGEFWVGTEDGGLNYFDSRSKTFRHFPFEQGQEHLSYHNVHALFRDREGRIWIGLFTGGLNVYDPRTGKISRYRHIPGDTTSLNDNSVYVVYEDRQGVIWVGTVRGLQAYDRQNDAFIRVKKKDLGYTCIYDVYEDNAGTLWVATYDKGLMYYNRHSGKWGQLSAGQKRFPLSSDKVISLLDDGAGKLWIGTDGGGLNCYDFRDSTVKVYDKKQGITGNVIYGILQDDRRRLWLTTNKGLFRFDPASGTVLHYTVWDNLQSPQFNYKSYLKASDGRFFVGGIKGFNIFHPDSVRESCRPETVVFTNFQLFNQDVRPGDDKSPLEKSINLTKALSLAHHQSVISLEYSALSYSAPEKVRYAYKMEGFDEDWNDVGSQRKATYTNLPPGEYTFRVRAAGDDAGPGAAETSLRLTVHPPFYKTRIAYVLYGLLLLAAVSIFRGYLILQARKKNRIRVERLKNQKEQEFYKQKIEFFTAMAHEIRTPLSLIMAPLEKLSGVELPPAEKRQLKLIRENSGRLSELVNQLLDFRRIESDIYEIRREQVEIVSMVQAIYSRFSAVSYERGLKFTFSTRVGKLSAEADPEALNKILSNLLINAVKFTRTQVKVSVEEPEKDESGQSYFSIAVEDDGIGIPAGDIDQIFRKFFKVSSGKHQYSNLGGTGIGLALAKSLTEKHGGKLLVSSTEGVQTIFRVLIPYNVQEKKLRGDERETDRLSPPVFPGPAGEGPRILLADDDPSILEFVASSLGEEGYQVLTASSGREAWEQLEQDSIDLVISDIMMPEGDGLSFCRRVRSDIHYSHIPFILLTARANSEAEIAGVENGADAYIVKPFKWKYLAAVVRNLLESRARLKQKFSDQPFESPSALTTNSRDKEFIERITSVIEERMQDPQLSVEELGREMAMSRSSLHKKLKSLSGIVPNEFIRLVRLKHAARFLLENRYTISEISHLTGFGSHSYFSKCFFRQFGLTPSEFVEKYINHDQAHPEIPGVIPALPPDPNGAERKEAEYYHHPGR